MGRLSLIVKKPGRTACQIEVGGVYGDFAADFPPGNQLPYRFCDRNGLPFKQNLEGVVVAGEILPRPPVCQKNFFDRLGKPSFGEAFFV